MDVGIGLALGIAGRAINSLLAPHKEVRVGQRLENLNAPKSSYGVAIPRVWGRARVGGNLIWASKLQEKIVSTSVGGKNLWATSAYVSNQYVYFGTAAYSFCQSLGENGQFLEVWANERLVWVHDGDPHTIAGGQATFGQFIHWHPHGGNDSLFDVYQSISQNDLGIPGGLSQNETEAYLSMLGIDVNSQKNEHYPDHAYIVLDGLPLTYDYSNTFPTLSAVVEERGTLYCKDVLYDLCRMAGYLPENIDVSLLTNVPIDGYVLASTRAAGDAIAEIGLRQPFTLLKRGKRLVFTDRASGTLWNIPYEHLGARVVQAGAERTSDKIFSAKETSSDALPQEVSLICYDSQNYYHESKFTSRRESSYVENYTNNDPTTITASLVLSPTQAQQVADRMLWELWQEKVEFEFTLPRSYLHLEPGDGIQVEGTDWGTLKVTQVTYGANLLVQIKAVTYQEFTPSAVVTSQDLLVITAPSTGGIITLPAGSIGLTGIGKQGTNIVYTEGTDYIVSNGQITIPVNSAITQGESLNVFYETSQTQPSGDKTIIVEGDTTLRALDVPKWNNDPDYTIYVLATGGQNWQQCSLYGSRDGQNYTYVGNQSGRSTCGVTNSVLGATVDIALEPYSLPLVSVSSANFTETVNLALIGTELLRFQTVTQLSATTWRLSVLQRGLFGTESQSFPIGTPFSLLSGTLTPVQLAASDVGSLLYLKAVTKYQSLDDVAAISFVYSGKNKSDDSGVPVTVSITVPNLAAKAKTDTVIAIRIKPFLVTRIQTNAPARINLFHSLADQAIMSNTSNVLDGFDKLYRSGVMLDISSPVPINEWVAIWMHGYKDNSPNIPISITNVANSSATITVTLTYIGLK